MARKPDSHHVLPLFCDDLIASCVDMSPMRFGAYMRILCYAWTRGGVPNDEQACSRIAGGLDHADWVAILSRLCLIDAGTPSERLSHQRLELERHAVAELKAKKAEAGRMGGRAKANGKQSGSKPLAEHLANAKQTASKTLAPTPTPSPCIHTHTNDESGDGKPAELWSSFRERWNGTSGAEPWLHANPPAGPLWEDRISDPAWLEQYPLAMQKLCGLKRFKNPVTLTQFLDAGWVGRILAGDFSKAPQSRGRESLPETTPPQTNRRFFRSDSQRSMTDAEHAVWLRDKRESGTVAALAGSIRLTEEVTQ